MSHPYSLSNVIFATGTFNPPTNAHLANWKDINKRTGKRVVVIPNPYPGHKQPGVDGKKRVSMVKKSVEGIPSIRVSNYAERTNPGGVRGGTSYTDMYMKILAEHPPEKGEHLNLLIGSDKVESTIKTLYKIQKKRNAPDAPNIFEQIKLFIRERSGYKAALENLDECCRKPERELLQVEIVPFLKEELASLSSTVVRNTRKEGGNISKLVPNPVLKYIKKHRLYV